LVAGIGTSSDQRGEAVTIVCEPDRNAAGVLAAIAAIAALSGQRPHLVGDLPTAERALAAAGEETVLVIGTGIDLEQALRFAARLRRQDPQVAVILLCPTLDFRLLARATGAGVREVIPATDEAAIAEACRYWQHHPAPAAARRRRSGRIVTVVASRDGSGKTVLATNLAVVLGTEHRRVCLLDLDLRFGDVASALRLRPQRSLVDAVQADRGTLDAAAVAALVTPFRPGLDCILAPVGPGEPERVRPELVGDLLAVLPSIYDYIVVDTPAELSATVLCALDAADHHLLVTTPEIPALRSLRRTLDILDLLAYSRRTRWVVLNRASARTGLSVSDVEDAVRGPVAASIPASQDVPASVNRGVPLAATQPHHTVTRAIRRLAETRLTAAGREPPRSARRR
jgi:pilus assembly protein CpaE